MLNKNYFFHRFQGRFIGQKAYKMSKHNLNTFFLIHPWAKRPTPKRSLDLRPHFNGQLHPGFIECFALQATGWIGKASITMSTKSPVYVPGTTYSRGEYTCPQNVRPPPPCEKCGNPTYWRCSRVRQDIGWLHEFVCLCTTRKCINTPPVL